MSIAHFSMSGHLMLFNGTLDACSMPVFTLGYKHTDDQSEQWTARFVNFKFGNVDQAQAIRGAHDALALALPTVPWVGPVGLVAAIGSQHTVLQASSPLFKLGQRLAGTMKWSWLPTLLSKKAHPSLHKLQNGTAAQRSAIVQGVYMMQGPLPALKTLLILDDFTTRGDTFCDIGRALQAGGFKGAIYGLALGKSEKKSWAARVNKSIENVHVPRALATAWDNA